MKSITFLNKDIAPLNVEISESSTHKYKITFDYNKVKHLYDLGEIINAVDKVNPKSNNDCIFIPSKPYNVEFFSDFHDDSLFLDVFYDMKDVDYSEILRQQEIDKEDYMTGVDDIFELEVGKTIFKVSSEDDSFLIIEFDSIWLLNENNEINSLWDYNDGYFKNRLEYMIARI